LLLVGFAGKRSHVPLPSMLQVVPPLAKNTFVCITLQELRMMLMFAVYCAFVVAVLAAHDQTVGVAAVLSFYLRHFHLLLCVLL
jgi:hypothetical protein